MTVTTKTLAEGIADRLADTCVGRIFGIPGGGSSLDLIDAAAARGIDFVLTRTETAAALMAAVTGELTGTPGVALAGIGPGAASIVNGVAYAQLERSPLILFTDGPASSQHQAFDQNALFRPVTKAQGRLRPATGLADLAVGIQATLTPPFGPVQFNLSAEDAVAPVSDPADGEARPPRPPPAVEIPPDAVELLHNARRPVVIGGLEARYGRNPAALRRLAEALACPVFLTYKAKGVIADSSPWLVGLFTGAEAEAESLDRADLILCFGLDPVEIIPRPWRYRAAVLDLRLCPEPVLPMEPAGRIIGDLSSIADELIGLVERSEWSVAEVAALRRGMRDRLALDGVGHTAQSVAETVCAGAPRGCRATIDSGAHMFSVMSCWQAEAPYGVLKSNGLSTMGYALPAAIASALAEPDRRTVAITGDGGLMMCLGEMATAIERGCRVTVVVLNDAALSLIDIKQQRQQRQSRGVRYPCVDFAAAARALGCPAWRVAAEDSLEPVLAEAFAIDGPALIDIVTDPSGYGDQLVNLRG
ncbi:MAG: thiamine pyrophosphate-binding protein [Alphaproteobacteria bacterium]|nr:thiamine pyrophosphate-binding protein [Alphaproteobacteria bacterium]